MAFFNLIVLRNRVFKVNTFFINQYYNVMSVFLSNSSDSYLSELTWKL